MLVLTRKLGQRLVIGDNVTITVTRVSGNRVTLGIQAPDEVRVIRAELREIADQFCDDEVQTTGTPVLQICDIDTSTLTPRCAR